MFLNPQSRTRTSTNFRGHGRVREQTIQALFATRFPFSKKLSAHESCVNALALSSGDGRWLASGGDDPHIHLWDFHQEDIKTPTFSCTGPTNNVFNLEFSAGNSYLYSGGADNRIIKYDLSRLFAGPANGAANDSAILSRYFAHIDSIRAISCHPSQEELFLSGGEDGKIILHDDRVDSRMSTAQSTLRITYEVTDAKFHPRMEHIFATSDSNGNICLRDTRMAFGPLSHRTKSGVVQTFHTRLANQTLAHLCNPEVSSIAFDREGSMLMATMLRSAPTLFSIVDPWPIAVCNGTYRPDGSPVPRGERTYYNSCTMKHGSFGGAGLDHDVYYSAGSDDFRGYVWKIPPVRSLTERRQEFPPCTPAWASFEQPTIPTFADTLLGPHYLPVVLSTPFFILAGHNSIVNTVLIHPLSPYIFTSGIERHIILHSPTENSPSCTKLTRTLTDVRSLPDSDSNGHERLLQALVAGQQPHMGDENDELESDASTIALFDEIIRQEGGADVFATNRYIPHDDEDEDEIDTEEDEIDTEEDEENLTAPELV